MPHQQLEKRQVEIRNEVHEAVEYMDSLGAEGKERANAAYTRDYGQLAAFDDRDLIPIEFHEPFQVMPNVVKVVNATHLRVALEALDKLLVHPTSEGYKDQVVRTEEERVDMQRHLGFRGLKRALAIVDSSERSISWKAMVLGVPFSRMSKLEYATMVVAPRQPWDEDLEALNTMGYENVHELVVRIKAFNMRPDLWRIEDTFVSLPFSARPQFEGWRQEALDDWAAEQKWEHVARGHDGELAA
jgi:hypothetical protein